MIGFIKKLFGGKTETPTTEVEAANSAPYKIPEPATAPVPSLTSEELKVVSEMTDAIHDTDKPAVPAKSTAPAKKKPAAKKQQFAKKAPAKKKPAVSKPAV
jgi:hypothetical protein